MTFVFLFGAMYVALSQTWSEGLSRWVIDMGTVQPAAWTARALTGDSTIIASGSHLRSPQASVNVLYGCEGTDVWMLLSAALLATPIAWRRRVMGLAAGTILVFALNQARVLALFFAIRYQPDWFGTLHGLVAPLVVVLAVTAFFLAWLRSSVRAGQHRAAHA